MISFSDLVDSSENPNSLGAKFRQQRQAVFESLFFSHFSADQSISILDVGGTPEFWKKSKILDLPHLSITLLNLSQSKTSQAKLISVTGDATAMPEYPEASFDLVFSNSVIEHLYTFENQQKMASEILRIGKKYFVQTPNRYFPIEAHYALPFAQFWPKKLLFKTLTQTKLSRLHRWPESAAQQYLEEIRLLDQKEMKQLFPDSKLYLEKVLGLCKSITAHNF
ncbi:methyltransferase domain-containing protein [Algoriphagus sp.]|uniref:methyltransferase domain-containing protein n=1 Tax=Algoriphagus sp. TaxID=1872435 RepID=UPI002605DE72|nr:methyltransferase domain-containing protein [Algoriphagus sp.]